MGSCVSQPAKTTLTTKESNMAIEAVLKGNFPTIVFILNTVFGILACACMIGFQIGIMFAEGPLWFVGTGIWVGAIIILCKLVGLVLIILRNIMSWRIWMITQGVSIFMLMCNTIIQTLAQGAMDCTPARRLALLVSGMVLFGLVITALNVLLVVKLKFRIGRQRAVLKYRKSKGEDITSLDLTKL